MFTQQQKDKLADVERQVAYYQAAQGLKGLPQPTSQQSVYIDRIVSMLGFDKDPHKGSRMVDVIMTMISGPEPRPPPPHGWAVAASVSEKDATQRHAAAVDAIMTPALEQAMGELAHLVFDNSVHGDTIARIERFVRTCDATAAYADDDDKALIDATLSRHALRHAYGRYARDFNTCHYVARVHADGGTVRLVQVPGVEPFAYVRGRYYVLRRRDKHYRYWIEVRCMRRVAELTGPADASQWRTAVRAVRHMLSDSDLLRT